MKFAFLSAILCSISFNLNAQSYLIKWQNEAGNKDVHVHIDTGLIPDGIHVYKEFAAPQTAELVDQSSLLLIGDFNMSDTNIVLDYTAFNYYLIPFNPDVPFINMNNSYRKNDICTYYLGAWPEEGLNPGDWIYVCSSIGRVEEQEADKCSIHLNADKSMIQFVDVGQYGDLMCLKKRKKSYDIFSFNGGAALVQVSKEKEHLYHDFRTGPSKSRKE